MQAATRITTNKTCVKPNLMFFLTALDSFFVLQIKNFKNFKYQNVQKVYILRLKIMRSINSSIISIKLNALKPRNNPH
jgi:hypothetical protein